MAEPPRKILLVEDDDAIRETLVEVLMEAGYAVDAAADGKQALDLLRSGQAPPSMIFLDLMMPVMDGFAFLEERDGDPALKGIPVVIMSADGQVEAKIQKTKVDGYLRKPMTIEAFLAAAAQHAPL